MMNVRGNSSNLDELKMLAKALATILDNPDIERWSFHADRPLEVVGEENGWAKYRPTGQMVVHIEIVVPTKPGVSQ